ncbi:MAG: cysteine desulfurase family protein [Oscillospiraceae bacterium]
MREIYLDNSATTRVYKEAADEAYSAMTEFYGNPSSLHNKGIEAERIMEDARKKIAAALGADGGELVFTSGGTEANNLAVIGGALAKKRRGNRVVISAYEHDSVMRAGKHLSENGFDVVWLSPNERGEITPEAVFEAVNEKTVLVSVMLVNNEVGAVNPVAQLSAATKRKNPDTVFHCDAVQAFCKMPFRADKLGADLVTVTAHKIGGPKGVGALWIKKGARVLPLHFGGEQEKEIRPGTEALPLIAAFGKAAEISKNSLPEFQRKMEELRNLLLDGIKDEPGILLNSKEGALPGIVNLSVPGIRSEIMLHFLESRGIYVSSGSACAQGAKSHVLKAMGYPPERIDSALRISFGRENTPEDVEELLSAIKDAMRELCR